MRGAPVARSAVPRIRRPALRGRTGSAQRGHGLGLARLHPPPTAVPSDHANAFREPRRSATLRTSMADPLIEAALSARQHAHAPYSHFLVGAAIEDSQGRTHTGCNIENATYGLTVCAERVAVWKALSEGAREFHRIAIAA